VADERLQSLITQLQASGVEVGSLPALQVELDALEEPPGFVRGLSRRALAFARTQWTRVLAELGETREAGALLQRRLGGETLSPQDEARLRAQVADLVRLVPASVVCVAIEAVPIPGSSIVTPWVLDQLGLMPSQWREAHLLEGLRDEAQRLRLAHRDQAADQVEALCRTLTIEAELRRQRQLQAELHILWDKDGSGHWDEAETAAYDRAVAAMRGRLEEDGWHRCWFLWHRGRVFGPVRALELREVGSEGLLITHEREEGWVVLGALWA